MARNVISDNWLSILEPSWWSLVSVLQPKTIRNTLVSEEIGCIVYCCDKENTLWGIMNHLSKGWWRSGLMLDYLKVKVKWSRSVVSDSLWPHRRSQPGSSIHGIFQARVLEWVAISFSRESSWPRDWTQVSCIVGRCFTIWATKEVTIK